MHRCLLIPDILCTILEFTQQCSESSGEDGSEDQKLGRRTLASLAQTCRAISSPALDRLWMRLDSLVPLIKLLARRIWSKMVVIFVFLTELVWSGQKPFTSADLMVAPLTKVLAGPGGDLFLDHWSLSAPARDALFDLPNMCPNVTSFTYTIQWPYPQPDITARYIVDIVRRWPHLQALQISPCYRLVMTHLPSMPALTTLGIVVGHLNPVGRLPDSIRTFSLEMRGDWDSPYWLGTLQGNPTRFHLRIIVLNSCSQGMGGYLQTLPTHLDNTRLHTLAIEVTQLPYYDLPVKSLSSLTQPLLEPLCAFSALDLSSFCAFGLNDAVYARMATMWPKLTSLKVGTSEVSKGRPAASVVAVVAVIAVLRTCPHLQTFHIVFNGSVPPPPPVTVGEEKNVDVGVEEERAAVSQVNGWGVSNQHITHV